MRLPKTRRRWLSDQALYKGPARFVTEAMMLERNADWLLARLYEPDVAVGARFSGDPPMGAPGGRLLSVRHELINWGDLSASAEQMSDGRWTITLEEAGAGQCPDLCEYVRGWLMAWGWESVEVRTEW